MVGSIGSYGRLGSYGEAAAGGAASGAGGIVTAVVGGALDLTTAALSYAGQNKALNAQFLLADKQAKNDAATAVIQLKIAQEQTKAAQIAAAAQMSGTQDHMAANIVIGVGSLLFLGVGGYALYKWAVK